jgi:tetratricopeptide (TPR) repeat protein
MDDASNSDIDRQLEQLQQQAGALIQPCHFASSTRLYGELRRRARSEHRAFPYVMGTFFQMDQFQNLLEFQQMRERAIELIALLENEERIRQIQADIPMDQYEHLIYSMSSCAYENLAEATGQLEGYNSEGLHACITDGIQICRRTGKLGCIGCFREYACDVYIAADDPEIAMHQCRQVLEHHGSWSDRGDRRWVASLKTAWLETLHGRYASAMQSLENALRFTNEDTVPLKTEARLRIHFLRDTVRIISGQQPVMKDDPISAEIPPPGECPLFEHSRELNDALHLASNQQWNEAVEILTRWDQRLQRSHATHLWFETRLRLIAVRMLSGQTRQAESLSKQLEQRARQAHDWLTIRRLDCLTNAQQLSILAVISDGASRNSTSSTNTSASGSVTSVASAAVPDNQEESSSSKGAEASPATPDEEATPLADTIRSLRERVTKLLENPDEPTLNALRADLLNISPATATHFDDVASLIHMMPWLIGPGDQSEEVWQWANSLAAAHRENGLVLSVLGTLGDALRSGPGEGMAEKITADRTEQLFRRSLELEGSRARNHMRAGDHFLRENNVGEAERCFARAFRLDRTLSDVVDRLADLYGRTERPRDALHVLDLSLREGCSDPGIAFNAAMIAFRLDQFDVTQTYLDRFEALGGDNPGWCSYYRAVCAYETGRYETALDLLNQAEEAAEGTGWHLEAMRGATMIRLGKPEDARAHIEFVLTTPLHQVDFLSPLGMTSLLERILRLTDNEFPDRDIRQRTETRLLRSALMPESWFQSKRESDQTIEGLRLYRCLVVQPLDSTWATDPDRLDSESGWSAYGIEWGILAQSEEEAADTALRWQVRSYSTPEHSIPAIVEEVLTSDETWSDVPGVVWQSSRFPVSDSPGDNSFSDDSDDDSDDSEDLTDDGMEDF